MFCGNTSKDAFKKFKRKIRLLKLKWLTKSESKSYYNFTFYCIYDDRSLFFMIDF